MLAADKLTLEPLDEVRQAPFTAKQPPARLIPRAKVEVAAVPVMLRYVLWIPPANVEVAVPSTTSASTVAVAESSPPLNV